MAGNLLSRREDAIWVETADVAEDSLGNVRIDIAGCGTLAIRGKCQYWLQESADDEDAEKDYGVKFEHCEKLELGREYLEIFR